jgi:hypothetical protein
MNRLRWLLFPSVILVIACASMATTASVLPPGRREPAHWIPVPTAITKTGELRRDMLSRLDLAVIDNNRAKNATRCTTFIGPSPTEQFIDLDSLDSLVANSLTIVRGRVTASETGFYYGHPGTLYTLQPKPLLKEYGHLDGRSFLFLFIPEATIPTSQGYICARTFSDIPAPVSGDEVLAFVSLDPIDASHRIIEVDAQKQLVVVHGHQLFHPAAVVKRDELKRAYSTLDDLESAIRQNKHINDIPMGVAQ